VLADPSLAGWDGFGVVVQAYGRRAGAVIDWLGALALKLDRRIMVRLVKGAYWDAEVKRAQVLGLPSFPVFTRKQATDVSYIANARKLLGMTDRIYPQFATHNAHTVAAILHMAGDRRAMNSSACTAWASGCTTSCMTEQDPLPHLCAGRGASRPSGLSGAPAAGKRRELQFRQPDRRRRRPTRRGCACPLTAAETLQPVASPALPPGTRLFAPRVNARGWDLTDAGDLP
jgi:RHH-type transcriptional regulator, proline utilization regulon repressor / proline dehydrogenase / delta 1-pyrroline-5-carboxylate dehydrogenase